MYEIYHWDELVGHAEDLEEAIEKADMIGAGGIVKNSETGEREYEVM